MDMLVRELKEELEARDQPKTGNNAWLRRRLHGAIVRARASCSMQSHIEWTLLPFCDMGQTFTILLKFREFPTFTVLIQIGQTFITLPWDYARTTEHGLAG